MSVGTRNTLGSVAFMNNKGGVGKTTLACNMAAFLAEHCNMRILVMDLDPQCNATQLLLDEKKWGEVFESKDPYSDQRTVLSPLQKIRLGDSEVVTDIRPVRSGRFKVDVLLGHPRLALLEDKLSESWQNFVGGDLGGTRRTLWLRTLIGSLEDAYDLVVVDMGPSLGALNRSVLIGVGAIVTPTAADMFSVSALDNIADWIDNWTPRFVRALGSALDDYQELDELLRLADRPPESLPTYVGYTIQQYVTKTSADGSRRSIRSYDHYREQIPANADKLAKALNTPLQGSQFDLGTVPYMFSMVPLAQATNAPIRSLTSDDGVRGAQFNQRNKYVEQLDEIGIRLAQALGLSSSAAASSTNS